MSIFLALLLVSAALAQENGKLLDVTSWRAKQGVSEDEWKSALRDFLPIVKEAGALVSSRRLEVLL